MSAPKQHNLSVYSIEPVNVADPVSPEPLKDAGKGKHNPAYYAVEHGSIWHQIFEGLKKIAQTTKKTASGENEAGKILATVKDIVLPFVPAGTIIDKETDMLGDMLKTTKTKQKMNTNSIISKVKSALKTPAAHAAAGFFVFILSAVWNGVHLNATDLLQDVTAVVTSIAGLYAAVMHVVSAFHDNSSAQSKDAKKKA